MSDLNFIISLLQYRLILCARLFYFCTLWAFCIISQDRCVAVEILSRHIDVWLHKAAKSVLSITLCQVFWWCIGHNLHHCTVGSYTNNIKSAQCFFKWSLHKRIWMWLCNDYLRLQRVIDSSHVSLLPVEHEEKMNMGSFREIMKYFMKNESIIIQFLCAPFHLKRLTFCLYKYAA